MALATTKFITFADMNTMITSEGFTLKGAAFTSTNELVRKSEAEEHLYLNTSGSISTYDTNQLIPRGVCVDSSGGRDACMYSTFTNTEPSSCSTVTISGLHDGVNLNPMRNDHLYDVNNVLVNGGNQWCSVERYPGSSENCIIKVNSVGLITYVHWCSDNSAAPTGLNATSIGATTFTLNWTYGGEYYNPSLRVYKGTTFYKNVQSGNSTTITGQLQGGTATWYVRAYIESDFTGTYKQSSGLSVTQTDPRTAFNMGYIPSNTSSLACSGLSSATYYHDGVGNPGNGDTIWTAATGGSKFNGFSKYFKDRTGDRWLRIDTVGVVSSSGICI